MTGIALSACFNMVPGLPRRLGAVVTARTRPRRNACVAESRVAPS